MAHFVIPYQPRPLQRKLHEQIARFAMIVCHRRFGKTVFSINDDIKNLISCKQRGLRMPRGHYVAPLLKQAKKTAWDYVKLYTKDLPGYKANETDCRVDFLDDCRYTLIGADNPDAEKGQYCDTVTFDEYAQMPPSMWTEVFRPMLSDRTGKGKFIGTPKGKNSFYTLYGEAENKEGWNRFLFRASETGYVNAGELAAAKNDMTEEEYAQEYECSWEAAIRGAYYGKIMEKLTREGKVHAVPHESTLLVHTAWDLGIDDATAIWFIQQAGREYWAINYHEGSGAGLDTYVQYLKEQGYTYGRHYLPHDVKVKELSSGISRLQFLQGLGVRGIAVPNIKVDDGINAVRAILPRFHFDKEKCAKGIEALRQYRTDWDERTQTFKKKPKHDWTSHGSDALRYFAVGHSEEKEGQIIQRVADQNYDVLNPMAGSSTYRGKQTIAEGTEWEPW